MATSSAGEQVLPFICNNCQSSIRLDPSLMKLGLSDRSPAQLKDPVLQNDVDGLSVNLLKLLSDVNVPSQAPLCKECSDQLMKDMDSQLASMEEECVAYKNLIDEMKTNYSNCNLADERRKLRNLEDEERRLEAELDMLRQQERKLDDELTQKKNNLEVVSSEESDMWRQFRDNHRLLLDAAETSARLDGELRYAVAQHKKLAGVNVLDLCFHIWVDNSDKSVGTVNGLRLGRLPDVPVEWTEINAAWGQLVHLLDVLTQKLDVQNEGLKLIAMGSFSYIKSKKRDFPLYGSGSWKPFGNHNMDSGIIAFLECFDSLCSKLRTHDAAFTLNFSMKPSRGLLIGHGVMEYSAKMAFNSEERWTKAMKMLLTNLKTAMQQVAAVKLPS